MTCAPKYPGWTTGAFRYDATDTTKPPGPTAIPAGTWKPPAGALPASGNGIYLDSDSDNSMELPSPVRVQAPSATFITEGSGAVGPFAAINIYGQDTQRALGVHLQTGYSLVQLATGYYPNLTSGDLALGSLRVYASPGTGWPAAP